MNRTSLTNNYTPATSPSRFSLRNVNNKFACLQVYIYTYKEIKRERKLYTESLENFPVIRLFSPHPTRSVTLYPVRLGTIFSRVAPR